MNSTASTEPIQTARGPVIGRHREGIAQYLGIPFAAAPVGDRRWRSPQPVEPWTEPFDASRPGAGSLQTLRPAGGPLPGHYFETSEDCLNLNVYTPIPNGRNDTAKPVLFWVHGGSYLRGRGAETNGTSFARNGNIVVVTTNYRLGVLGFMELGHLDPERAGTHNLGIQDQIAALRWVHDNIAAFGGDPEQVTICGESAGAGSILAVLSSPSADGLFHRAISQSAPAAFGAASETFTKSFTTGAGVSTIEELLSLPAEKVLAVQSALVLAAEREGSVAAVSSRPDNPARALRPAIDGITVTRAAAQGAGERGIPLLIGSNDDEGTLFSSHLDREMSREDLHAIAVARVGDEGATTVIEAYEDEYPDKTPHQIAVQWTGDLHFWIPSLAVADAAATAGTPVYVYRFTWKSQGFTGVFGAMHALEIPFVWNRTQNWDLLFGEDHPEPPDLADRMHQAWINYVHTGDPSHEAIGVWPTYNTETRPTMTFGENSAVVNDPGQVTRLAWAG